MGEALLWVPRIVLFPAYLATEYLFHRPLNAFGRYAELNQLPTQLVSFLSFGEEQRFVVFPTAFIDFGLRPSVGLHFVARRFPVERHRLSVDVAYGGSGYYGLGVKDSIALGESDALALRAGWTQRPDRIFHGLGGRSREPDRARFGDQRTELFAEYERGSGSGPRIRASGGLRDVRYTPGGCCGDPTVEDLVSQGRYPAPPGLATGFRALVLGLQGEAGEGPARPSSSAGVSALLALEHAFDVKDGFRSAWVVYGGSATGFVALNSRFRVLSLSLDARFARPTGGAGRPVPFTELARLGGSRPLQGFRPGRLLGDSALAATLEYRWPIWSFLDGYFNYELGNVFGPELRGLAAARLRQSVGFGVKAPSPEATGFSLTLAFGSRPFEEGGAFDEMRFIFGVSRDF